jgi:hypothetical protein
LFFKNQLGAATIFISRAVSATTAVFTAFAAVTALIFFC